MKGAIIGDIIGAPYEFLAIKNKDFDLFDPDRWQHTTDDSILTFAIADKLINGGNYQESLLKWSKKHPDQSWGTSYARWFKSDNHQPYNSFGNGSAMRVSPVGWLFNTLEETLEEAKKSAEVTHNHPEGIKGAQAVATAIFMARNKATKEEIKKYIEDTFEYNLSRKYADFQPDYTFDVTCQGSVPEAIICFLESTDFEDAIRNAVALGGDADTQACITGSIAEAFYGKVPANIWSECEKVLDTEMQKIIEDFYNKI